MGATKWTDLFIRNLEPKAARYDLREGDGFTVRVSPTGGKSFYFVYTLNGIKRRLFLGEYDPKATDAKNGPDAEPMPYKGAVSLKGAHRRHSESLALVKKAIDPILKTREEEEARRCEAEEQRRQEEAEAHALTVSSLAEKFIESCKKEGLRSWEEYERYLNKELIPELGAKKATDVTRADIREVVGKVYERGAEVAANRALAVIRRLFNWAVEEDLLSSSPTVKIKRPHKEEPKTRTLTADEIRRLWTGLDTLELRMSAPTRTALKLILATAQRPGEVASLRWADIDGDVWQIPEEKAKNGLPHRVPLPKLALDLLKPLKHTGRYAFPSPRGDRPIDVRALSHALRMSVGKLGFKAGEEFTPHDLRRSAASRMAEAGVSRVTISRLLNHRDHDQTTRIYERHSYDLEKRQALQKWAGTLKKILEKTDGAGVISLSRKQEAGRAQR